MDRQIEGQIDRCTESWLDSGIDRDVDMDTHIYRHMGYADRAQIKGTRIDIDTLDR